MGTMQAHRFIGSANASNRWVFVIFLLAIYINGRSLNQNAEDEIPPSTPTPTTTTSKRDEEQHR